MLRTLRNILPWLLLSSLALGACSCEAKKKSLHQAAPVPTSIELSHERLFFDALGLEQQLEATIFDQLGETMEKATLQWSSSDPSVVSVNAEGTVTSQGNGRASLKAQNGKARATVEVEVKQLPVKVEIEPASLRFEAVGGSAQLQALAFDRNEHPVEGATFLWSSENESVATVGVFGAVEAVAKGNTYALAQVEGSEASGKAEILVEPASATLRFHFSQPHWVAGSPAEVQVEVLDPLGNRVQDARLDLRLRLEKNPPGGSLSGTLQQRASGGLATFSDLSIDKAGEDYSLYATAGDIVGESEPFDVVSGAATRLRFVKQPQDTVAGESMAPVAVQIEDAWGNPVPGASHKVVLSLVDNAAPLLGELERAAEDGLATFETLQITQAGSAYRLHAKVGGWEGGATSEAFAILPAAPAGIVWLQQPQDAASGADIGPVQLAVVDPFANTTAYSGPASVSLLPVESEAVLSGDKEIQASAGQVLFPDLSVDLVGEYQLAVQVGALGPYPSQAFHIRPGAPAQLIFLSSPEAGVRNQPLAETKVQLVDEAGNLIEEEHAITLSLQGGPGSLHGNTSQPTSQGLATFGGLSVDEEGTFQLVASAEGVDSALSPPFPIAACLEGLTDCGGICVDLESDPSFCGSCENACGEAQSCELGSCACNEPGAEICGAQCVHTQSDPSFCGDCFTQCDPGEACEGGSCQLPPCPAGQQRCDDTCVDTNTDDNYCGDCFTQCGSAQVCQGGSCQAPPCPAGQELCNGVCVDTSRDANHCGACNEPCKQYDPCVNSVCMPDPEYANWPLPPENPPNSNYDYASNSSVVLDHQTKLMWQRGVPAGGYTWQGASSYCEGLHLAGYSDWRLPTRIELLSIVSSGLQGPSINRAAFPNTPSEWFWTSTPWLGPEGDRWGVSFYRGGSEYSETGDRVRCVRFSEQSPTTVAANRYEATPDTVLDLVTGLRFQRHAAAYSMRHYEADSHCANLIYGGMPGRVPRKKELESLVDVRTTPGIHQYFTPYSGLRYWSSTPWSGGSCCAGYYVSTGSGYTGAMYYYQNGSNPSGGYNILRARCVWGN